MISLTCAISNMTQMNLSVKQKETQTQRIDLQLPKDRKDRVGIDWEFGISRCKLLYVGWINNKRLLYSTRNCIHYFVINCNGKEGNPLQSSCLENPMDRGAWQAAVHGVAQSRPSLKRLATHRQELEEPPQQVACCLMVPRLKPRFCVVMKS